MIYMHLLKCGMIHIKEHHVCMHIEKEEGGGLRLKEEIQATKLGHLNFLLRILVFLAMKGTCPSVTKK